MISRRASATFSSANVAPTCTRSSAQTDYREFAGRPHLMMVADGWEEIAGEIEQWLDGVLSG
jgi:hypothetical protein